MKKKESIVKDTKGKKEEEKNNWVKEKLILKKTSTNVTLGHGGDSGGRGKKRGIIHSVFCGFLLKTKTFNHISFEYLRKEEIFCELFLPFFFLFPACFISPFCEKLKVIFVEKNHEGKKSHRAAITYQFSLLSFTPFPG